MVSSITMNLFKHDKRSKKRVVRVLPPETTNNSIVSIDPVVDFVDSPCNDQSKLLKNRVDEQPTLSKKESSNFGENSNDVNVVTDQKNNKNCVSKKIINLVITYFQDIPDPNIFVTHDPHPILRLEPLLDDISTLDENNKYTTMILVMLAPVIMIATTSMVTRMMMLIQPVLVFIAVVLLMPISRGRTTLMTTS